MAAKICALKSVGPGYNDVDLSAGDLVAMVVVLIMCPDVKLPCIYLFHTSYP